MPKRKLESNIDLVNDLMNYSPYGGLCQAFIMEAIMRYAEEIVANPMAENSQSMFSGKSWNGIAADVKKRCDTFYGRHTESETPCRAP